MHDYILASLIALTASIFCIHLLRPLAVRLGFVDRPSGRKRHKNETPLIGGVAIFFGFCFALLSLHVSLMPYRSLLAGCALLVLVGVVDDFRDLSARVRLFAQLMVALMLSAWGGVLLAHLGNILTIGDISLGLWALPVTVVLVIAYINAFNMIDGEDGLAGGVAMVQAFWLFMFAEMLSLGPILHLLVIVMVLLAVFLNFNMRFPWRKRASIFLGDSGSTMLAFLLVWVAIMLSQAQMTLVNPVAMLWVLALPLFDLMQVVLCRVKGKKSIFTPGRDHVHHLLQDSGFTKKTATLILVAAQFSFGGLGFLFNYLSVAESISFGIYLGLLLGYLIFIASRLRFKTLLKNKLVDYEISDF